MTDDCDLILLLRLFCTSSVSDDTLVVNASDENSFRRPVAKKSLASKP